MPLVYMRKPADGNFKKLLKASSLLATPAPIVSAVSSVSVGTLYPVGHTDVPSVFDQLLILVSPDLSTEAQSPLPLMN